MKQERDVPAFFIDVWGETPVHECVQIQLIVAKCTERNIWCRSACHGRHEGQKIKHAHAATLSLEA